MLLFLLSGQYMHFAYDHLYGMATGPRMLYRSAHIYLMWSALLNFLLGCHFVRASGVEAERIQKLGSLLILMGPFVLCVAFFYEPQMLALSRPFSRFAIYSAGMGTLMHGYASLRKYDQALNQEDDQANQRG